MRYLLINLALLAVSCGTFPKKQNLVPSSKQATLSIPYFANPDTDYIYKAHIEVRDKHFGGLLIIKKTGENSHRIAFTTEMGNTIFDFSFRDAVFKVHFIPEELDRKMLLKILEQDFRTLVCEYPKIAETFSYMGKSVLEGSIDGKEHYFFMNNNGQLEKTIFPKNGKTNIVYRFSKINSDIAHEIEIEHLAFNMNILLKSLDSL